MPLPVSDTGGGQDFPPIPPDIHPAVCIGLIDLGTQQHPYYKNWKKKVAILWELPETRIDITNQDGITENKARVISKIYTQSLSNKATLRKDLVSWRGVEFTEAELKSFDLETILGKSCRLNVINKTKGDRTFANVDSVIRHPKGAPILDPESSLTFYSMHDHLDDIPEGVSGWIRDIIYQSAEMTGDGPNDDQVHGSADGDPAAPAYDDEIPF